jgi:hypothetical protein
MADAFIPYAPLNRLKPVAKNVWIADGPEIGFKALGMTLPFPTRVTVIRLRDGGLFVHSPIAPDAGLLAQLEALGPVAHLIAPSLIHYWWIPDWAARFPAARVHAVPGLAKKAKRPLRIDAVLGEGPPPAWAGEIEQMLVSGDGFREVEFFHRPSATLVLTDLIENFEPARVKNRWLRWLVKAAHAADPHGSAPYDMRLALGRHRARLRDAVWRMLALRPERVILAHGRWYERDGAAELARACAWAL